MFDFDRQITIFAGHYGSGKTNLAVNYALKLRERHDKVAVADLDIVNPYFRTADSKRLFEQHGIRLIASDYVNTNVEVAALPPQMNTMFDVPDLYSVIDLGGDDRGAYALGRFKHKLERIANVHMLLVVNKYRPLSATPDDCIAIMREIEEAGRMKFTGIVNNSNLGHATTPEDVLNSVPYTQEISRISGLPVIATSAEKSVAQALIGQIENIFPMELEDEKWQLFQS